MPTAQEIAKKRLLNRCRTAEELAAEQQIHLTLLRMMPPEIIAELEAIRDQGEKRRALALGVS